MGVIVNYRWIWWQVVVPVIGPIALGAAFIALWSTGARGFVPDYANALANMSPWGLTFYSIALLGSTLNTFWPKLRDHPGLGIAMIVDALAVCVYAGFIAVWRHDSAFVPGAEVYTVTIILLAITIVTCHISYQKVIRP